MKVNRVCDYSRYYAYHLDYGHDFEEYFHLNILMDELIKTLRVHH